MTLLWFCEFLGEDGEEVFVEGFGDLEEEVGVEAFKPCGEPLAVCLSKGGEVLPNVAMKAAFTSGDGVLTADTKTDASGTAVFYVTNVTSKLPIQTVEVRIDESFLDDVDNDLIGNECTA